MKAATMHAALRELPLAPLSAIAPGTVMVLAPHPDDESLGCGGLIAACCAAGMPPVVVIMTDGAASHPNSRQWPAPRLRAKRQQEARNAVACLGLPPDRLVFLGLPDAAAPHDGPVFADMATRLAHLATARDCTTLLVPWRADPHCDHEAAWKMGVAVQRLCGAMLLAYPVWGWLLPDEMDLDHAPPRGLRLDITAHRATKARAIGMHESQYGGLITDDPDGFHLPDRLLDALVTDYEVFVQP
ncbi:PIG-L deacetylase family protein [Komagataeibacter oboediens]|uniref:PIG-L deacetylase family protein n=1 Tax=Komagataeibacter oboediens TaxID=65958 RepID=UPI001C2D6DBA|nr:PIG-L deacetylase family protein [Komagataeibacter oboediens]MBV1823987.1 PIG-L family deacetylase [Komagataeibacter oboediens]